jgi:hypothetical protein
LRKGRVKGVSSEAPFLYTKGVVNTFTRKESIMNGYIALYKNKKIEVFALTSYAAQQYAAQVFKAKKAHEVTVYLAEKAIDEEVIHQRLENVKQLLNNSFLWYKEE